MRILRPVSLLVLAVVFSGFESLQGAELKVLDKPLWIFPGQTFRIVLQQPKGSGKFDVQMTPAVEMFDTWPQDAIQRFYFRAVKSGDATLTFKGNAGTVRIPLEVIAWADIFKSRKLEKTELPRIWPLGQTDYRHTKKRRTFYSDEDLRAIRKSNGKASGRAKKWLAMSDEEIWNIIPGPCVARTCLIVLSGGNREDGRGKGCPVCGMKVYEGRSAFYPWIFDPKNHPWKVGCPSCGSWFPSNDWHKGDMHSGDFPDDGFGCEPLKPILGPNGVAWRWPFIAYYHQWTAYMNAFTPGIDHCAEAFAASGDRRYAHKAAIGLFRFAESMLDMSLNLSHRKMAYRDAILRGPVGAPVQSSRLGGTFLYIQPNWDTPRMEAAARAWDMIFDALDGDEELLEFCRSRHHPEIRTGEDFRRFVEAGVIRTPLQAALDNAVARNYPMQEVLVATMALVMDSPQSLDLVDWLLGDGAGIRFALANNYFKDGSACESEGYNAIHVHDMERIFGLLGRIERLYPEQWKRRGFPSLYDDPKYRLLYDFPIENSLIGRSYPATGDSGYAVSGKLRAPRQTYPLERSDYVNVYRRIRDPRFAQVLYGPDGKIPSQLRDPKLRAEVARIAEQRGWQVKLTSNILDGYGHVILRSGSGEHQRAFWLRYGRVYAHRHLDMLTMGLSALGRDLLPELGYPQGWTNAGHWAANWGTHYGTHITGVATSSFFPGSVTLFADASPARVATVLSTVPSDKQKTRQSRTIVLVDLSPRDCYAVTLQRVLGGGEHTLSFHGPQGPASAVGLELTPQTTGTALGPELQYGDYGPIQKLDRELSCLAFMYDVKRARPKGVWAVDYPLEGQDDVHLRMTMVEPEGGELALAKGKPTQGKKSYELN